VSAWQDHDLVFAAANDNPMHPDNLARDYKRVLAAAGVPRIRIHDQGHTHITLALRAGAPLHGVSRRIGHARPSTTMDNYAHVTRDAQDQAAEAINAVLFAAPQLPTAGT
jgi:integrase